MPIWWALSRIVPWVFSDRKTAPWVRKMATNVAPPSRLNGLSRSKKPPAYSMLPVLGGLLQRHPAHDVGEGHAPEQRGHERAEHDRGIPAGAPLAVGALAAVLEGDPAHDQRHEDQEQREVEPAEQGRVPLRERRERRATGHEHPHLVAVPDRTQCGEHGAPFGLGPADDRQQHAHTEVEALKDEVPDPEHGDQDEPDGCQFHVSSSRSISTRSTTGRRAHARRMGRRPIPAVPASRCA